MRNTIGIRRESVDGTELRAALAPDHVRTLCEQYNIRVIVEPSPERIFTDSEYAAAGAELSNDLSESNVILGVKEIPADQIEPGQTYCYFSHTVKAQRHNMAMLAAIIEKRATLIDYELVTNDSGRRLIFFGDYAGYAGMINVLWALGKRLDWEQIPNPFATIKQAIDYDSLQDAEEAIARVGHQIRVEGLPKAITPFVCVFTGRGQVSRGAQKMFQNLPMVRILPDDLASLEESASYSDKTAYVLELNRSDLYVRKDGRGFDLDDFNQDPGAYTSALEPFAARSTLIVNGIYWSPRYPRLITREWIESHYASRAPRPLKVIGDITCDIEGSIEFNVKATRADSPVYVYEPESGHIIDGWQGDGPVVLAVDNLPAELPRGATSSFGDGLMPFMRALASADFKAPTSELSLPEPIRKAIVAHGGHLTPSFHYLNEHILGTDRGR